MRSCRLLRHMFPRLRQPPSGLRRHVPKTPALAGPPPGVETVLAHEVGLAPAVTREAIRDADAADPVAACVAVAISPTAEPSPPKTECSSSTTTAS